MAVAQTWLGHHTKGHISCHRFSATPRRWNWDGWNCHWDSQSERPRDRRDRGRGVESQDRSPGQSVLRAKPVLHAADSNNHKEQGVLVTSTVVFEIAGYLHGFLLRISGRTRALAQRVSSFHGFGSVSWTKTK